MGFAAVLVFAASACVVTALDNGLALTPPMGWMSWERFACDTNCDAHPDTCIGDKLYRDHIDRIATDGYHGYGFEYVNIDDCWPLMNRDSQGNIVPDPKRFPEGVKGLADYAHSKGLKLGLYLDIGTHTCGGYPGFNCTGPDGSDRYKQDLQQFASWGIDSLKVDGCYESPQIMNITYPLIGAAMNATGRPILYSCSWPAYEGIHFSDYAGLHKYCNLWRNYDDINDSWDSVLGIISYWAQNQTQMVPAAGPGAWNDPDMIIVGDFGLSTSQWQAQFAMWSMFAAPLYMSNDLRTISIEAKQILMNAEVIAVDQDPLGKQGTQVYAKGDQQIWRRDLFDGSVATVALNTGHFAGPQTFTISFSMIGVKSANAKVRDLINHKDLGTLAGSIVVDVNPVSVAMFKVTPA